MACIEHADPDFCDFCDFCDLYVLFQQVLIQLDDSDPHLICSLIGNAHSEFCGDGLHRPADVILMEPEPLDHPSPVVALNTAVKTQLTRAQSLDEALRLTRARTYLLEAVDAL